MWVAIGWMTCACGGSSPPLQGEPGAEDSDPPGTWRSALYPRGWLPPALGGSADGEGRFLADYSYAGYRRGDSAPPIGVAPAAEVVVAPGGGVDATPLIQSALDRACAAGGGVVELAAGVFRIRLPSPEAEAAIQLRCSNLVLRGAGPGRTRIVFVDPRRVREKDVIRVGKGSGWIWRDLAGSALPLAEDAPSGSQRVVLTQPPALAPGDLVLVRNEIGEAFRAEHRMDAAAVSADDGERGNDARWEIAGGIIYLRRVVSVQGNALEFDAPIRYPLKVRDAARIAKPAQEVVTEVGLESFSIGMLENLQPETQPSSDDDFGLPGTRGYEVHASSAIRITGAVDGWIHDVDSFRPGGNTTPVHVLSHGMTFSRDSTRFTLSDCDWAAPQYRGGGGNGYLFHVQGSDHLVLGGSARAARHGLIFQYLASGVVVSGLRIFESRYADDSHTILTHQNLVEGVELNGAWLQSVNRGATSSGAGFTGTQNVFWATRVLQNHPSAEGCAVESAQWEHGFLIGSMRAEGAAPGTQALLCPRSFSDSYWAGLDAGAPMDWVEGQDIGATLFPPSLYRHQLAARCAREGLQCPVWP